jgi:hypothetical protein
VVLLFLRLSITLQNEDTFKENGASTNYVRLLLISNRLSIAETCADLSENSRANEWIFAHMHTCGTTATHWTLRCDRRQHKGGKEVCLDSRKPKYSSTVFISRAIRFWSTFLEILHRDTINVSDRIRASARVTLLSLTSKTDETDIKSEMSSGFH